MAKKKHRRPKRPETRTNKRSERQPGSHHGNSGTSQQTRNSTKNTRQTGPDTRKPRKRRDKMPGRAGKKKNKHSATGSQHTDDDHVDHYDLQLSYKYMNRKGFHPKVTSKTPQEVVQAFLKLVAKETKKPSRSQFISGGQGFQGQVYSQGRQITLCPLLPRPAWKKDGLTADRETGETEDTKETLDNQQPCSLLSLLRNTEIGSRIMENVFSDGSKTAQKLALTSTNMWKAVLNLANVWDFHEANCRFHGHNGVFIALNPEYTVGDFFHPTNQVRSDGETNHDWQKKCLESEEDIYKGIRRLHEEWTKMEPFWAAKKNDEDNTTIVVSPGYQKIYPLDWIRAVRSLKSTKKIANQSQFISYRLLQVFEPPVDFAVKNLREMMRQIHQQRAGITVLHFQKTPYLDRRLLAIILRGCTNVQMLGVYDCPSIHFGDVICILDLIHEINVERAKLNHPMIRAFDFYPCYNKGMPYRHERSHTYGVMWDSCNLEWFQRGFYMIIMKAFMKATALGIELLFEKDHAFTDYLFRVPNQPLGVPTFLTALHRYLELNLTGKKALSERKKVIYDLLKPVRLGLCQRMEKDWPQWYQETMGEHLVFCASCGYETFQEFFSVEQRQALPYVRVCSGCILQRMLDGQTAHLKQEKTPIIDALCPDWNGGDFNVDAPMPSQARTLINLKTKTSIRPSPPQGMVNIHGDIFQPRYEVALVRDGKIHKDSLQKLPSLEDITATAESIKAWYCASQKAKVVDVYGKTICILKKQWKRQEGDIAPFATTRPDGGCPDTFDELQGPRVGRRIEGHPPLLNYTFESALQNHMLAEIAAKGKTLREPPGFW